MFPITRRVSSLAYCGAAKSAGEASISSGISSSLSKGSHGLDEFIINRGSDGGLQVIKMEMAMFSAFVKVVEPCGEGWVMPGNGILLMG